MMSVANTTGCRAAIPSIAMRWMRLMSLAENFEGRHLEADAAARELLGSTVSAGPRNPGPVIVLLLSSMSWLIFSFVVMRASNAASRASVPGGESARAATLRNNAISRPGRRE
jgi:hypothetical protein